LQPEFHGGFTHDLAKKSSSAGIGHVHILPTFQFVGVDDQKENWRNVGKIYNILSSE
jgi:pullulanase/glycogen debranching enzyme